MGTSVQDLINKINQDISIPDSEKVMLIDTLINNYSRTSPVSVAIAGVMGSVFGALVSKYFGMGITGTVLNSILGASAGIRVKNMFGI